MDVLALLVDNPWHADLQSNSTYNFVKHVLSLSSNKTTSGVLYASVLDRLQGHNPNLNLSSWYFHTYHSPPYKDGGVQDNSLRYATVREVLDLKIAFTETLFSEMSGVRKRATHIAIIFLNGEKFLTDDLRNIPQIVQEKNTDIKIFVVVLDGDPGNETIYLNDTLIIPFHMDDHTINILTLAICNQCMRGWFSFKHSHSSDFLSCYKLDDPSHFKMNWIQHTDSCLTTDSGSLAAIETLEELNYLRSRLVQYFKERQSRRNDLSPSSTFSANVFIGLKKDSTTIAKRFHWALNNPTRYRPLVVNNWMRGKPSGGYNSACGVWQFAWMDHVNGTNLPSNGRNLVEGWVDVGCRTKLSSFHLCEISLPRILEGTNKMRINPPTSASFNKALATTQCIVFGDNIVSVSSHIASTYFQKLMKDTGREFPLFLCGEYAGEQQYISYTYVCDGIEHCINRRDEERCGVKPGLSHDTLFESIMCCDGSRLHLQYVNDGEIDCAVCDNSSEGIDNDETWIMNPFLQLKITCTFYCDSDICIVSSHLNNGRVDCHSPDGHLDETLGKLKTASTCYNIIGHVVWAPMCVYIKDSYGAVRGCRDMSHLNACADFDCPEGYVKCPNTYCIPQHNILDGKVDCPTGEDEQHMNIGSCSGHFECWNSKICLHPDLVCNEHSECPHGDDEVDCNGPCHDGLRCISGTATVSNYTSVRFQSRFFVDTYTKYLDLSGVDLRNARMNGLSFLINVMFMYASNCKLRDLDTLFRYMSHLLYVLDISNNLINEFIGNSTACLALKEVRFLNLSYNTELVIVRDLHLDYLETFDLSHTAIEYLDDSFLRGLPNLNHLNLSYTLIFRFHQHVSPFKNSLQVLDLRSTSFDNVSEELFNRLAISQHIYTDKYHMCCPQVRGVNIPYYTCHGPDDSISSCVDMIGDNVQRILLWLVAALAVLGNLIFVVCRVTLDASIIRAGYELFVTSMGISGFIMGVYAFIIVGADCYYRSIYVLHDKNWRTSRVCLLAGFLATISTQTSTLLIFLITLDRMLVLVFPIGHKWFSERKHQAVLLLSWIMCFLLALIPIVFRFEMYSSNAMCFGLPLSSKRPTGWWYSFGVFIVYNCTLFLLIACCQLFIFRAISTNGLTSTSAHRPEDVVVVKHLSRAALFNCICWCPVGIMGLLSLCDISNAANAWTMVVVVPINAAANPVLYSIPSLTTKWERFKHGGRRFH